MLDSSVLIARVRPSEPEHEPARAFVERLEAEQARGDVRVFGPPELWLEVHVVEQRTPRRRAQEVLGQAMSGLTIELVQPDGLASLTSFVRLLERRMRGRRPFSNATDLVYLWAAHEVGATVVTLDAGLLAYHGVVCDVTRPQHIHFR